jgi:hypothetical protein
MGPRAYMETPIAPPMASQLDRSVRDRPRMLKTLKRR